MKAWLNMALVCALGCGAASAQISQAELMTMTWSWTNPIKWLATSNLSTTNYGYFQDNTVSPQNSTSMTDWRNWRFVAYTGLNGKNVTAWADWGLPYVPSPVINPDGRVGDNCQHSHMSYGVWLQYGYYSGGTYYSGVVGPIPGGSKSGTRVNSYTCTHSVNNSLNTIDARYGWGNDVYYHIFPKTGNVFNMLIVGAMSMSHGGFGCSSFTCVNQPWIGAFAINN